MINTIFKIVVLLTFVIIFSSASKTAISAETDLAPHITVCATDACFKSCLCLSCSITFFLYDSTNTLVDSCSGVYPFSVCCTISGHSAGNYHFVLFVPNCITCTGATFYYDGMLATDTINCTNCSGNRKTDKSELPKVYSLAQNYPNPFNPATSISYSIPKSGFVTLVVYDDIGNKISTLVNENKEAGSFEVHFDASNFASGVYFYRIDAGDFTSVKKMLLIK